MPKTDMRFGLLLALAVAGCGHHSGAPLPVPPADLAPSASDQAPSPSPGDLGLPLPPGPDGGTRPPPPTPAPPTRACGTPAQCGLREVDSVERCDQPEAKSVAADLDGDGHPDWIQPCSNGLWVRTTQVDAGGNVSFAAPRRYLVGDGSGQALVVATGDLNGDHRPDLVVRASSSFEVRLSGAEGYAQAHVYAAPANFDPLDYPQSGWQADADDLAVGDVDGDGFADVVFTDDREGLIAVYRGHGDGSLATPTVQTLALDPFGFVMADLDGDGRADLVLDEHPRTQPPQLLAYGQADGRFRTAPANLSAAVASAVVADFNGDQRPDVLSSLSDTSGQRSLSLALAPATPGGAYSLSTRTGFGSMLFGGDFDGDGHTDVVELGLAADVSGDWNLALLLGDGSGGLSTFDGSDDGWLAVPYPWLPGLQYVSLLPPLVADLNGDGLSDLVAQSLTGSYAIGYGSRTAPVLAIGPTQPDSDPYTIFAVGDLDGDRLPDVVAGYGQGEPLQLLRGLGGARFGSPQLLPVGGDAVAMASFDGQPGDDLFILAATPGVWTGVAGPFQAAPNLAAAAYTKVQTFALFGEAKPALLLTNATTVDLARSHGDGTFADALTVQAGDSSKLVRVLAGDFDCDGKGDLLLHEWNTTPQLEVRFGDGTGAFAAPLPLVYDPAVAPNLIWYVAAGDFDGDGCTDVAFNDGVTDSGYGGANVSTGIQIWHGSPTRGVVTRPGHIDSDFADLTAADFDGDGHVDLLRGASQLLLNHGDGTWDLWATYTVAFPGYTGWTVADADGDGDPDVLQVSSPGIAVLRNTFR